MDWSTIIGGIGGNILNNTIQYYTQKNQQRQAQANTRKNMQEQAQLEDESWYNRVANSTAALKAAGLSPVLATGQPQGAASVSHSEAMPQVSAPSGGVDLVSAATLNQSQRELNEAAADKARAEADKTRLESGKTPEEIALLRAQVFERNLYNKRLVDADKAAADFMSSSFKTLADKADSQILRDVFSSFANKSQRLSVGSLDSWIRATDWLRGLSDYDRDSVLNQVQKKMGHLRLGSDQDLHALADMPFAQFKELMARSEDLVSSRQLRDVQRKEVIPLQKEQMSEQTGNIAADTQLKGAQMSEYEARAAAIPQEVEQAKHKNFVQMIDDGEYGNAAWYIIGDLISAIAGFLVISRLKGAAQPAPSRPRTTTKSNVEYNYPKDMPKDIQQSLDNYYKGEYE